MVDKSITLAQTKDWLTATINECAKFVCHRCKAIETFGPAYYEPEDAEWQHIVKYSDHEEHLTCDANLMRTTAYIVGDSLAQYEKAK